MYTVSTLETNKPKNTMFSGQGIYCMNHIENKATSIV